MKKILFGILTFLGIGLSFCSADTYYLSGFGSFYRPNLSDLDIPFTSDISVDSFTCLNDYCAITLTTGFADSCFAVPGDDNSYNNSLCSCYIRYIQSEGLSYNLTDCGNTFAIFNLAGRNTFEDFVFSVGGGEDTGSVSTIDVYYNNGNSVETITCDGTQAISIDGLSTVTSTNTFTPYFNIDYIDEDNQLLTESYSKDILYLSGTTFKKTFTGNNIRILTVQGNSESIFTGYVPVFDVTGTTQPVDTEYNMFNNFADNSLKVLLSNIPGYIQYVFIIGIILLLIGIVKMLKRRK